MLRTTLAITAFSLPLLAMGAALAGPCAADPALDLTAFDTARLEALETSRAKAAGQIAAAGDLEGLATLEAFYEQGFAPAATLPVGDYRCRTVKLGGPFGPFTAYSFFQCRVSETPDGLKLDKLTGSQRFSGYLTEIDGGLVFRGASHYGDEQPRRYGDDPDRNEVACLGRSGGDSGSWLLEFPQPRVESEHDVIELVAVATTR